MFLGYEYTEAIDYYAFGIIIFELLFGYIPYDSDQRKDVIRNVLVLKLTFPKIKKISNEVKDLISGLLERDVKHRLKGDDVKNHPFFKSIDWKDMKKSNVFPKEEFEKLKGKIFEQ